MVIKMQEKNFDEMTYELIENVFGDYRKIIGKASRNMKNTVKIYTSKTGKKFQFIF